MITLFDTNKLLKGHHGKICPNVKWKKNSTLQIFIIAGRISDDKQRKPAKSSSKHRHWKVDKKDTKSASFFEKMLKLFSRFSRNIEKGRNSSFLRLNCSIKYRWIETLFCIRICEIARTLGYRNKGAIAQEHTVHETTETKPQNVKPLGNYTT